MKSTLLFLSVFCLLPLHAQVTVVPSSKDIVVVRPAVRVLSPAEMQRQLSMTPRVVVVPVAPSSTVKTTKTATIVETPGQPRRVYNAERNVVVVVDQNQSLELPYVTLPVLFEKETAELLDKESRAALEQVAAVIHEVSKAGPGTLFDIEGHTSTEGTEGFNLTLSAARAQRVFDELTQRYGVPASVLSAHGYGEGFPQHPKGTEKEKQQDRRVLVVRTK
jgi:outer membrane protein OmpA-like peptidoglycan-associated protein